MIRSTPSRLPFAAAARRRAAQYITPEMIEGYQIAGTPAECSATLQAMIAEHQLDVFLLNISSPSLEVNTHLMQTAAEIVRSASD